MNRTLLFALAALFSATAAFAGPFFPFAASWAAYNTSTTLSGGDPVAFAIADFDNDGAPDVVATRGRSEFDGSGFYFLRNDGEGRLAPAVAYTSVSNTWGIVAADFNGDSKLDVAVSNGNYLMTTGNTVSVFLGNGDGTFVAPQTFSVGTGNVVPQGLAAADFDGDGDADLAVAAYGVVGGGSTVRLLYGNGAGGFSAPITFPAGEGPYKLAVGDLNSDGRPDLVAAVRDLGIAILRNENGTGFSAPVVHEAAPNSQARFPSVALGDVEGDGDLDVFAPGLPANERGRILVYRNDGTGALTQSGHASFTAYTASPWDIAAADLNGDGRVDLIGAHHSGRVSDGVVVALNDGSGNFGVGPFAEGIKYLGGQGTYAVAAADMDGDGAKDVLTTDDYSMAVTVRFNNGAGLFPIIPYDLTGAAERWSDAADIDGDRDLDLFTSGAQGSVLRNDGTGRFGNRQIIAIAFELVNRGVFRDLNGDNKPDLLFNNNPVNSAPYDFFYALNNGNGTFGALTRVPVGSCGWGEIDAIDLDNDGDLDVVDMEALGAPGCDTGRFWVALNNGNGTFGAPYPVGPLPFRPDDVSAADYNEDGNLDLAMTAGGAYGYDTVVMVVLGNGNGTFQPVTQYTVARGPADILAAHLDADGHLDLAVTSRGYDDGAFYVGEEKLTTLFGTGTGSFNRITIQYAPFSPDLQVPGGIQAGDLDADGDLDLMTSGGASNDISIYYNNGAGLFTFPYRLGAIHDADDPYYADFTGDGVPDLAVMASVPPPIPTSDRGVAVLRGLSTLRPLSAVSRKVHGAAGPFDLSLPLTGSAGIESRRGSGQNFGSHQVVVSFPGSIASATATVASGTGTVESASANGTEVTINLANVSNAQTLMVSLSIAATGGQTSDVPIPIAFLVGDTNGNGSVNATDVGQAKAQSGQSTTTTNFRADVNVSGAISAPDVGLVKSNSGTALP
jgi:hypothetical protein